MNIQDLVGCGPRLSVLSPAPGQEPDAGVMSAEEVRSARRLLECCVSGTLRPLDGTPDAGLPEGAAAAGADAAVLDRPLVGDAAGIADEACRIVFSGPASRAVDLERLAGLRQDMQADVAKTGDRQAQAFMDALSRAALVRPLSMAAGRLPADAARAFTQAAAGVIAHLEEAADMSALEQAQHEIDGLRALLRQEGMLDVRAEEGLGCIEMLAADKAGTLTALQAVREGIADLQSRDAGGLPADDGLIRLNELASALADRAVTEGGFGRPPLGGLVHRNLLADALSLKAALATLSAERARPLLDGVSRLEGELTAGEQVEAEGFEALGKRAEALHGHLLPAEAQAVQDGIGRLRAVRAVTTACRTGEALLKTSLNVPELDAGRDRLEALPCPEFLRRERDALVLKLNLRISALRTGALRHQEAFLHEMQGRVAADSPEYGRIHERIAERLALLPGEVNLSDGERRELEGRLKALDQEAYVKDFTREMTSAVSARLDAPSLAGCLERIRTETGLSEDTRARLAAAVRARSAGESARLAGRMAEIRDKASGGTFEDVRAAVGALLALPAGSRLLPEEKAAFDVLRNGHLEALQDRLEALALEALGRDLPDAGRKGARVLLQGGGFHPSLVDVVRQAPEDLLEAVARAADGRGASDELLGQLDGLMGGRPELDDELLAVKTALTAGGRSETVALRHEGFIARRNVMNALRTAYPPESLKRLGLVGNAVSTDVLGRLVDAALSAGDGDAGLKVRDVDLLLLQALWCERRAEGMAFADFQRSLPAVWRQAEGLERLLGSGIGSTERLTRIAGRLERISTGFGGRQELLDVCDRLASSDDRWAAEATLTTLTRNLLGGMSFTGRQAMEGGASAVRGALERELHGTGPLDDVRDALRVAFRQADPGILDSVSTQLADFCAKSATLQRDLADLGMRADELAVAREAVLRNPARRDMLAALERFRGEDEEVAALKRGEQAPVRGAMLATGILMLKDILERSPAELESSVQVLAGQLRFQKHVNLGRLCGSDVLVAVKEDEAGREFKALLDAIVRSPGGAALEEAKTRMLDFIRSRGLEEKCQAVLYFKRFRGDSNVENLAYKTEQVLDARAIGRSPELSRDFGKLTADLQRQYVTRVNRGTAEAAAVEAADDMRAAELRKMERRLADAQRAFSSRVIRTLGKTMQAAVCEAFLNDGAHDSLGELLAERRLYAGRLDEWPFLQSALAQMVKLGIPEEVARPFLMKELMTMNAGYFTALKRDVSTDPLLKLRGMMLGAGTPAEMKRIMKRGAFDEAAKALLDGLGPDERLTLGLDRGASVAVPVLEVGAGEVSANIGAAVKNGMSLWADGQGVWHMTLMKTAEGTVGLQLSGFLEMIEAGAKAAFSAGEGCDLTFTTRESCGRFLSALLSGQARGQDLGLCSRIRSVRETGIGGELSLSAEWSPAEAVGGDDGDVSGSSGNQDEEEGGWLSFSGELQLAGAVGRKRTEDADSITLEHTRSGTLSLALGLAVAPESVTEKAGAGLERLSDLAERRDSERLRNAVAFGRTALGRNETKLSLEREFIETRSVRTSRTGLLQEAVCTRSLHVAAEELEDALAKLRVPASCAAAVMEDGRREGGEFLLNVSRSVPRARLDGINVLPAASRRVTMADHTHVEVELVRQGTTVQETQGLEAAHLTLARTVRGAVRRSYRYSGDL